MKTEPTEAYEAVKYYEASNINIDAFRAKKLCDMAFYEGQSSPIIKQLEWDFYGLYYDVKTAVGHYMILQGDEQYLENYGTCTLTYNGNLIADFNSIDEAQSAAQDDFEKRVKGCLE